MLRLGFNDNLEDAQVAVAAGRWDRLNVRAFVREPARRQKKARYY